MDQTDTAIWQEPDIDYADILAEFIIWDALSDEALELFESTVVATPRQPTCL